ncbi:bifunctional 5,10-methylene-tetrahydrofolate dehydrogenase/5,10-methylene-tetrahydrofolate cyclohydrolase [Salibacteraceae bacterium]|jgi:methylenetetrahydrofolate dehydrogenase (NADP+)/methenyltetrahydrofolate cyclohydrolase|nr:bifunctional 5,10-methylene-tetrahydrofolate dehydrogenase/5,10-methylene-tetrahydrofolate cyclohydrolase [Salibacteraceae bacterium]
MTVLDGKESSNRIKDRLASEVAEIKAAGGKIPHLAAILVGEDGASQTYVNAKVKACERCGFKSSLMRFSSDISEAEVLGEIQKLNEDPDVDGFIVQLPLPKHIDELKVTLAVDPNKDVDGFHPENVGRMSIGLDTFIPATPYGIMQLLAEYDVPTEGKNCVVMGRSNIVGTPMSILMSRNTKPGNSTVTMVHSRTQNVKEICREADILIVALGKAEMVDSSYVKDGAVIVDVGITRLPDQSKKSGFRLAGDVLYSDVAEKCSFITPVPGGVGPMTIVGLMMNTLKASKRHSA